MLLAVPAGILGACAAEPSPAPTTGNAVATGPGPDASIEIHETQASLIGSVAWGSGTLTYRGMRYPIRVRGIGIGGVGFSRTSAMGEVYGLKQLNDFSGLYGEARTGAVVGDRQAIRAMWLENTSGVRMRLYPRDEGLALQIGADGVLMELAQ
jgi:hypothetical protein